MAPRGNGNGNRARAGGSPYRARSWNGRGRGGRRTGRPSVYTSLDVIDVDVQQYTNVTAGDTSFAQRGRGWARGRGRSFVQEYRMFEAGNRTPAPPRRENNDSGRATPIGRGGGRGPSRGLGMKYNANMPLSKLLALDRPYLRPINFVPAQLTPVLFQREEELIEVEEFIEPEDHVPTAERISRVFSNQKPPQQSFFYNPSDNPLEATDSEPVITVDFNSLGMLIDSAPTTTPSISVPAQPKMPASRAGESILDVIIDALTSDQGQGLDTKCPLAVQAPETCDTAITEQHSEVEMVVTPFTSVEDPARQVVESRAVNAEDVPKLHPVFVMDPNQVSFSSVHEEVAFTPVPPSTNPLGSKFPDDDEVIVYVAPHPRSGRATPSVPVSTVASAVARPLPSVQTPIAPSANLPIPAQSYNGLSFSFGTISKAAEVNRLQTATPRSRRLTKKDRKFALQKMERQGHFGTYGAMLEEMHLHEDDPPDVRREGSDIDWGDSDTEGLRVPHPRIDDSDVEKVSSSLGGMDIDDDLDLQFSQNFVEGMSAKGMQYTRIDDLADAEKLRLEDEEGDNYSSGSSIDDSELDAVNAEEEHLITEPGNAVESGSEGDDDDDISTDEEETPRRNFQARLEKARQSAKGKGKDCAYFACEISTEVGLQDLLSKRRENCKTKAVDSDDLDDDVDADTTWADRDEIFLADIQDMLDENDDILSGRNRMQKRALFSAIRDGEFAVTPAKKKHHHGKDLSLDLRSVWENDRARKAENKRKRAAARLAAATDPFAQHKGGKKGQKTMLRASCLAAEAEAELLKRGADIPALVHQIRAFLADLESKQQMTLPPMDKESRAKVHEIACAFNLKSTSKGKGDARYTTLVKTRRTGMWIDERKVERIVRSGGDWGFTRPGNPGYGGRGNGGKGNGGGAPRHRDGDEVGKLAPKIGEGNIGFKMLAGMGWTEGERIGVSGGLDAPLPAIIKSSKLGLGATHWRPSL